MSNMDDFIDTHLKPIFDAIHALDSKYLIRGSAKHCNAYRNAFMLIRTLMNLSEDDAATIIAAYNNLTAN